MSGHAAGKGKPRKGQWVRRRGINVSNKKEVAGPEFCGEEEVEKGGQSVCER